MNRLVTTTNPELLKQMSKDPNFISAEIFRSEAKNHLFKVGEHRELTGLVDFPEFNGEEVEITSIRQNGDEGRAYYIKGCINEFLNWVYEYRLK